MCIYSRLLFSQKLSLRLTSNKEDPSGVEYYEATIIINQSTTQDVMQEGGKIDVGCVIIVLLWALLLS